MQIEQYNLSCVLFNRLITFSKVKKVRKGHYKHSNKINMLKPSRKKMPQKKMSTKKWYMIRITN